MSFFVSGSLSYDTIMNFPDSFKNHILPEAIHVLNVSFVVNTVEKNFGGTAGNIAYTTKLLGGEPLVVAPLGKDGDEYQKYFSNLGIETQFMPVKTENFTSAAYITTDQDDNQITAFHPGILYDCGPFPLPSLSTVPTLGFISPTKKELMMEHAKEMFEQNIPFVFDPGQMITTFSGQELMRTIGQAKFLIANDYEMRLLEEKTGWDTHELLNHVETVILTLGEKGSVILTKEKKIEIPPCPVFSVEDPTGAGDAYRAGFFVAYEKGMELETCGKVASVAATYAVEKHGTQTHAFTMDEFKKRFEETYNQKLSW